MALNVKTRGHLRKHKITENITLLTTKPHFWKTFHKTQQLYWKHKTVAKNTTLPKTQLQKTQYFQNITTLLKTQHYKNHITENITLLKTHFRKHNSISKITKILQKTQKHYRKHYNATKRQDYWKHNISENTTLQKTQHYQKHNVSETTTILQKTQHNRKQNYIIYLYYFWIWIWIITENTDFFVLSVVVCCMLLCFHLQGHTVVSASTQINWVKLALVCKNRTETFFFKNSENKNPKSYFLDTEQRHLLQRYTIYPPTFLLLLRNMTNIVDNLDWH